VGPRSGLDDGEKRKSVAYCVSNSDPSEKYCPVMYVQRLIQLWLKWAVPNDKYRNLCRT
jgi:hypothetical protein